MNFTGQVTGATKDWKTGTWNLTFSVNEGESALIELDKLQNVEKLAVDVKQYSKKRSLDANGLLWACLGEMAVATRADKWDIYLTMLKRYGKFTHVCIKPEALEDLKRQWRETEVVGELTINGKKATIPSLLLKPGDVVSVKESSRDSAKIKALAEALESKNAPKCLDVDKTNLTAKVVSFPAREDIDFDFNEQLIVELYSK